MKVESVGLKVVCISSACPSGRKHALTNCTSSIAAQPPSTARSTRGQGHLQVARCPAARPAPARGGRPASGNRRSSTAFCHDGAGVAACRPSSGWPRSGKRDLLRLFRLVPVRLVLPGVRRQPRRNVRARRQPLPGDGVTLGVQAAEASEASSALAPPSDAARRTTLPARPRCARQAATALREDRVRRQLDEGEMIAVEELIDGVGEAHRLADVLPPVLARPIPVLRRAARSQSRRAAVAPARSESRAAPPAAAPAPGPSARCGRRTAPGGSDRRRRALEPGWRSLPAARPRRRASTEVGLLIAAKATRSP